MSENNSSGRGSDGMRLYPQGGTDYPLRFFNMLHFDKPRTMAECFKWCIKLDESHGLLHRITDTMARYPVTHALVTGDTGENHEDWSIWLNEKLNVMDELVSNGKDYYSFGNCVVSVVPPFKRYLVCPKCNTYKMHCINDDNDEDKPFKWKFHNFKFIADCHDKKCNYKGVMEVKDEYFEGQEFINHLRIVRWPILNIKIRDLPIAGKKRIYYRLEDKYRKPILAGDRFVVANVPYTFILAVKQNGNAAVIELPSDMTFHYKYETITEPESEGLAKPFFFSAWKDIFMSFILRKAQECIASDHLIPNRFIFPTATPGGKDPLSQIDGGSWVSSVLTVLKRQQNDPNEIGVVPFPLGYQAIGGQGKNMSLREEIELQDRRILTQMGVPPELIYGGMTWSGSNVSLRMLENLFIYYINKHNKFLKFIVDYAARISKINPPTEVKLSPFKMADDIQQIQTLLQLGATGRISETESLSCVGNGINLSKQAAQMKLEEKDLEEIAMVRQRVMAKVQAEVSKISGVQNVDNNIDLAKTQNEHGQSAQGALVNGAVMQTVEGISNKLTQMNPIQRQATLKDLQAQSPGKFNAIIGKMHGFDSAPLPEQKPPRRSPDKAKV